MKSRITQLALICYWLKTNDRDLAIKGTPYWLAALKCSKELGFVVSTRRLSGIARTLISHEELAYYIGFEGSIYGKELLTSREWSRVTDWLVRWYSGEDVELTTRMMKRAGIKYISPGIVKTALHATRHTWKKGQ